MARFLMHPILRKAPKIDRSLGRLDMARLVVHPILRKAPKIDRSLGRLDMAHFGAALHSSGNLAIPS